MKVPCFHGLPSHVDMSQAAKPCITSTEGSCGMDDKAESIARGGPCFMHGLLEFQVQGTVRMTSDRPECSLQHLSTSSSISTSASQVSHAAIGKFQTRWLAALCNSGLLYWGMRYTTHLQQRFQHALTYEKSQTNHDCWQTGGRILCSHVSV